MLPAGHRRSQQPLRARQGTAWPGREQRPWGHGPPRAGALRDPPYFAEEITTECLSDSRILARWKATESA